MKIEYRDNQARYTESRYLDLSDEALTTFVLEHIRYGVAVAVYPFLESEVLLSSAGMHIYIGSFEVEGELVTWFLYTIDPALGHSNFSFVGNSIGSSDVRTMPEAACKARLLSEVSPEFLRELCVDYIGAIQYWLEGKGLLSEEVKLRVFRMDHIVGNNFCTISTVGTSYQGKCLIVWGGMLYIEHDEFTEEKFGDENEFVEHLRTTLVQNEDCFFEFGIVGDTENIEECREEGGTSIGRLVNGVAQLDSEECYVIPTSMDEISAGVRGILAEIEGTRGDYMESGKLYFLRFFSANEADAEELFGPET